MKGTLALLWPLFAALLALAPGGARADYMDWSYQWSISPGPVFATPAGPVAILPLGGDHGAPQVPIAQLTSVLPPSAQISQGRNYDLTLLLTDHLSHQSGSLTFHGYLQVGYLGAWFSPLYLEMFNRPWAQDLVLEDHTYHVTISQSIWLPFSGLEKVGSAANQITARVSVSGPAPASPEPSGLALGGAALSLLAAARGWKRYRLPAGCGAA